MIEVFLVIKIPVNASGLDMKRTARHGSMIPLSEALGGGEVTREFHIIHDNKVIEVFPIPITGSDQESKLFKITDRVDILDD